MSGRRRDGYADVGEATRAAVDRAMDGLTLPEARIMLALVRQLTSWSILEEPIAARQLADLTGMDDRAVRRAVASLSDRGAIVRRPSPGRRASIYRLPSPPTQANPGDTNPGRNDQGSEQPGLLDTLNPGQVDPLNPGCSDHLPEDYARTTPEDSSRRTSQATPDPTNPAARLCNQLADAIAARGSKRPTVSNTWLRDMDRLLRLDDRTEDDVSKIVAWLATGADDVAAFWAPNIRSPRKLREKWDQMREQYQRRARANGNQPTPSTTEAVDYGKRVMGLT